MVSNEAHTNTCWKLLIRLSLSSGSGIIGKFLISHTLKIMWDMKQPWGSYQTPEHALGDKMLCCWISFLASSRSDTFLSCCLLRFSTWANISSTARLTRASWRRQHWESPLGLPGTHTIWLHSLEHWLPNLQVADVRLFTFTHPPPPAVSDHSSIKAWFYIWKHGSIFSLFLQVRPHCSSEGSWEWL